MKDTRAQGEPALEPALTLKSVFFPLCLWRLERQGPKEGPETAGTSTHWTAYAIEYPHAADPELIMTFRKTVSSGVLQRGKTLLLPFCFSDLPLKTLLSLE